MILEHAISTTKKSRIRKLTVFPAEADFSKLLGAGFAFFDPLPLSLSCAFMNHFLISPCLPHHNLNSKEDTNKHYQMRDCANVILDKTPNSNEIPVEEKNIFKNFLHL